jgi:hypothetical protein
MMNISIALQENIGAKLLDGITASRLAKPAEAE